MNSPDNRLVPETFSRSGFIENEWKTSCSTVLSHYPSLKNRLRLSQDEIRVWEREGMPHNALRVRPSSHNPFGVNFVMDHPNYLKEQARGKAREDDGVQDFHDTFFASSSTGKEYRDGRGLPIHPYFPYLMTHGAVGGFGYYWNYGPTRSACAIVSGEKQGKFYVASIKKPDSKWIYVPGGMVDSAENPIEPHTAIREFREETGLSVEPVHTEMINKGVLASGRQTLHAWEEDYSHVIIPKNLNIRYMPLEASDDVTGGEAFWLPINQRTLTHVYPAHANNIRSAVLAFERHQGVTLYRDGSLHEN